MSIPSNREQASIIRRLISEDSFKEGEKAYIISNSWFSKWKTAVGYDTGQSTNSTISKIDNNSLLSNGVLKKALSESFDYVVLTRKVWNQFIKWYGGGPPIPIQVDYDPNQQKYVPVTRLTSINILFDQNKKTFQISKYKTIGDLKKQVCKSFSVPYESYKIFEIWDGKKDAKLDEKKVISQLCLKDGTTLLLDTTESQDTIHSSRSAINSKNLNINSNNNLKKATFQKSEPVKLTQMHSQPLQTQSQTQFSKWLSASDQTIRQDPIKSSPSRPAATVRRQLSSQNDLFASENSENDLSQFQGQNRGQIRLQAHSSSPINIGSSGICGLTNLGNTCFFNSALQCILHSHLLIDYIRSGKFKSDLAPKNPLGTKCQLVNAFSSLVHKIYDQKVTIEAPKEILSVLSFYAPHFAGFAQQDAHELLIFLLDLLHEDMNRAKQNYVKPLPHQQKSSENSSKEQEDIRGDGTNDLVVAEKAWAYYKSKNDSIIVDLFHGLIRSQLICPTCSNKVVIFEPFVTLSLPIPGPMTKSPVFLFVPYDPKQPKVRMSLPLTFGVNTTCFRQNLNAEIGRNFNIALCIRSRTTGNFEWTNVLPSSNSTDLIVFEIPDVKNTSYALSSITVNRRKSGFSFFSWFNDPPQLLDDLLLIPISKSYVEKNELEEAVSKRIEYLWDTNDREVVNIDHDFIEFASSMEPFQTDVQKKFSVEIVTTFFDRSQVFEKNKIFPFILTKTIKITLNPAFMKDYYGFNWNNLLRPVKNVEPKNTESVAPTLENCIKQFCVPTVLDENNMWYCPHCKQFVRANKKTSIWSLPRCLVFQFKRFSQFYNTFKKREGKIDFPSEIDFEQFIKGPIDKTKTKYRLYAVCEHYGSMSGGHYVAHAYVDEKKHWYLFNDSSCRTSSENDAHNEAAYLLFYERIEE